MDATTSADEAAFEFDHLTLGQRIVFGTGKAVPHTVAQVQRLGGERVMLIVTGSATVVGDAIAARLPVVSRVDGVVQHVPVDSANAATHRAGQNRVDVIVAIGGGSATGLAKAVALRTGAPIVAVPTTFAGSEATDVWGLTDREGKSTGSDPRVLPRVVVYDAELFASLPPDVAVSSGMNAIAHAVDGFWGPRVDPLNIALGAEGLTWLVPAVRRVRGDFSIRVRERMLYGAYLAAVGFGSAGSGMHHKICHVLGGRFGLSHSALHSVMLGHVVAFNAPAAPEAARRISTAFDGLPPDSAIFTLRDEVGAPRSLAELGMREADIPDAARECAAVIPPSNPRLVSEGDVQRILRRAWAGEPAGRGRS